MEGGVWQVTVHGVTNSWTGLSDFTAAYLIIQLTDSKQVYTSNTRRKANSVYHLTDLTEGPEAWIHTSVISSFEQFHEYHL